MSESLKRRFRPRDIVIALGVVLAFVVIVGILWQGFLSVD